MNMTSKSLYQSVGSLLLAAALVTVGTSKIQQFSSNSETAAAQTSDAAYRDGVYLGKLYAERGVQARPAEGRWNQQQDRTNFAAGYWAGYEQAALAHKDSTLAKR